MRNFALPWMALFFLTAFACGQVQANPASKLLSTEADRHVIQQIEDDLLKAENTSDFHVLERVLADDWLNLTPGGLGPNKAKVLEGMRPHAGQAPAYSVETQDMQIHILGDIAVAAYVKTYRAKENDNISREDTTHIFSKDHGVWKLKISRATIRNDD